MFKNLGLSIRPIGILMRWENSQPWAGVRVQFGLRIGSSLSTSTSELPALSEACELDVNGACSGDKDRDSRSGSYHTPRLPRFWPKRFAEKMGLDSEYSTPAAHGFTSLRSTGKALACSGLLWPS